MKYETGSSYFLKEVLKYLIQIETYYFEGDFVYFYRHIIFFLIFRFANKMTVIATPNEENTTECAHFIIFTQSNFIKKISPSMIHNIYKDAIYIHTFNLHKNLNTDLAYQYAIIVYRRNTAYLSCHKRMFLSKMPLSADNTNIGVFYDNKIDIINNLRQRTISEDNLGFINLQTDLSWGDLNTIFRIRNHNNRRDYNLHKYWTLEGCPAYFLSDMGFESDEEVSDMRTCIKQANTFYMNGIQKRNNKTLYSHFNNDVILKVYYKKGIAAIHYKGQKAFPETSATPYTCAIRYNERHLSQKIDDYLGEPVIIINNYN